jgi:hypothetical protein
MVPCTDAPFEEYGQISERVAKLVSVLVSVYVSQNRSRFDGRHLTLVPVAGLEPARAFNGPLDFKSNASAISPHRQNRDQTA